MLGRDLIIYILQNNLEDSPVFEDGKILGFLTDEEAAVKFGVGSATVKIWVELDMLDGVKIGDRLYIPANAKLKFDRGQNNA